MCPVEILTQVRVHHTPISGDLTPRAYKLPKFAKQKFRMRRPRAPAPHTRIARRARVLRRGR